MRHVADYYQFILCAFKIVMFSMWLTNSAVSTWSLALHVTSPAFLRHARFL